MILLPHILFGAAIGSLFARNTYLAIILAFLGHYLLDLLPHAEYSMKNLEKKQWRTAGKEIIKVTIDFLSALILVYLFSNNSPIVYACIMVAIIPDFVTVIDRIMPNKITRTNDELHVKLHFWRNKKISLFWRIFSQVLVVIVSLFFLRS